MGTQLKIILVLAILANLVIGCGSDQSEIGTKAKERISFPAKAFTISGESDTTIFGEQGTRLFIEKGTFQFADGRLVSDSITIELKEFYDKSDIILADLSTESNGQLLETGGMLHIKAIANGEEIMIRSDKSIIVHFPKEKNRNGSMKLFYADQKSNNSTVNNWIVDTTTTVKSTLKLGGYGWWYPAYDDSTEYHFKPKNYVDTGYYWNPLDFYVSSYNFSERAKQEVEKTMNLNSYEKFESWNDYGVECELKISVNGDILSPIVKSKVSKETKQEILRFLKNLPQLEPGKNKYGKIIERKGLLFIQSGNIIPTYQTEKSYIKSFNAIYSKYENSPIKNIDDAELEYYIFKVGKLGWINCDRFIETANKIDYLVQIPFNSDTKVKMVFSDMKGVLMSQPNAGKYVFSNVPSGKKATIIAIKNADGQFKTAFQEITISDKPLEKLAFKESSLAELRKELEKFN